MQKFTLILIIGLVFFWGCKTDDPVVDNYTPEIAIENSVIHTESGRQINITALVSDPVGLLTVNIYNKNWFLNKTIVLNNDTTRTSYNLNYVFKVPVNTVSTEILEITVTNVGGKTNSAKITVEMDGDFAQPVITVDGSVSDGATIVPEEGDKFDLDFSFTDNRKLSYVKVSEPLLLLNDSIGGLNTKTYNYINSSIDIPVVPAKYNFDITCADSAGNIATVNVNVTVSVSWDFEKMYIADVSTVAELSSDLFGVPMLITKTAEFNYQAIYFNEKANTPVRFIPQKTSFKPACFGADASVDGKLVNSSESAGIILPAVGYYKITICTNPAVLSYNVEPFDPMADPQRPNLYQQVLTDTSGTYHGPLGLVGKGFADCPNMNWSTAEVKNYPDLQLKQDPDFAYRWSTTVKLTGNIQFIIQPEHPWGWWPSPFWRFDNKTEPEATVAEGGENCDITITTDATYKFVWDQYLNRAKLVKQ